jgi:hypothetical protein
VKLYMKPRGDAEKRAVKLKVVTSVIVKTNKKGNRIVIKDGGANATVKVHSRRTKIRLNGKKAKRKKIKSGMTCEVAYEGDGTEAATLTCKK